MNEMGGKAKRGAMKLVSSQARFATTTRGDCNAAPPPPVSEAKPEENFKPEGNLHDHPCTTYALTGRSRSKISDRLIPGLVRLLDTVAISTSFGLWFAVYVADQEFILSGLYIAAGLCMIGISMFFLDRAGLYNFETIAAWPHKIDRAVMATALAALILTGLAFMLKISDQFSRVWGAGSYVTLIVLIVMFRGILKSLIIRMAAQGKLERKIAIYGAGLLATKLITRFEQHKAPWIRLVGIFDERSNRIKATEAEQSVLGNIDDLVAEVRRGRIDCVVIALPWHSDQRVLSILGKLRDLPVDLCLGADLISYHFPFGRWKFLGGVPIMEIADTPLSGWSGILKTCVDKLLAAVAVVLFAPILAIAALAVKLESRGPVLFRQARHGFNNEVIHVYKFRTMYSNRPAEAGVIQATRDDPRVTIVGRFLRRTSLDELPQILNVLLGNMAIVGPRPHAVEHNLQYAELIRRYHGRHRVKPGITGWAQVCGWRGETKTVDEMQARIECDIFYIENWSLWFDVKIILLTLGAIIRGSNAY